ncbi:MULTISPECIES: GNAT family N-acetyltransferase [unclassified Paenibacillus]|uniref:GNAT family N-acetyltransferase n=1 Tax=unclassified Paenibacillus TaxID=185978 RepID=UPI0010473973|nr:MULTISPECIES: GNAT family N-acetyltransferase [unclassified Paenibacillus]NIK68021.1 GNAT superfamily N-acetyltransferase [Paenibacillus sp. BK720]TCN01995.1 acetyltransferase (GNAT) family protein [Paenibacillus sp. BK033]
MTDITISFGKEEESTYIRNKLIEFNAKHVPEHLSSRYEEINLTLKDENGSIIGGMLSTLCWNWIEVEILWIDDSKRGNGLGTQLLSRIEQIAREKGCTFIKLNTFSFQAPLFYLKHGYVQVAVFEEAPIGSNHYYFKKTIA